MGHELTVNREGSNLSARQQERSPPVQGSLRPSGARAHRGFTSAELVATLATAFASCAVVLVLVGAARSRSMEHASLANLRVQATAHAAYAASWSDRQPTFIHDEFALSGNSYPQAIALFGCLPPLILGFGGTYPPAGALATWGYWLPPCDNPTSGSQSNLNMYHPFSFAGTAVGHGTFMLVNTPVINSYVNGRFMDRVFYAPADRTRMSAVGPGLESPHPFTLVADGKWMCFSSYIMSPAAMYHPKVFGGSDQGVGGPFVGPFNFDASFKSPTVSQCAHPELKSRLIEHGWLQNAPFLTNPAFVPGSMLHFNMGADSVPMTLFFDGHTGPLPIRKVLDENAAVVAGGGASLWMTPVGSGPWQVYGGYYSSASVDGTNTSVHVFTRGGILGRDQVTAGQ
ncbi:MAG: hypothetical protein KF724_08365 [Phycisphaeraceae bacterium]|nr:hypothetical protein [Phycisphaeraceae bacterium]